MTNLKQKYSISDESTSLECLDYYLFSYQNENEIEILMEVESGDLDSGYDD